MRLLTQIWLLLLLCFSAGELYASHISGAEITYKHIVGTTYRFKLKVYRDCNECKFNGIGGGDNTSSCNEVPALLIKGALGTSNSTSVLGNIEISRKYIQDITPSCNSSISKCRPGSNSNLGYEVHVFEGDFNFDKLMNDGYCKLDISISMSSRSININTQQSEQNFFNYAMLNLCEGWPNESVEFLANPQFIHYLNQSNFSALNLSNPDKDSLVFNLKPALVNRNASINYAIGRSSDIPYTYFCQSPGAPPCPVNLLSPLVEGFYCSKTNGDIAFTPIQANQGGVMVVECEEWKKNSIGTYYLAGVVRRDVYAEVLTGNNNLPSLKLKLGDFSLCEGESFSMELNVEDLPFGSSLNDTVYLEMFSDMPGASIEKIPVSYAPYFKYNFKVMPSLGQSGKYLIGLNIRDNHCPLNGQISKSFSITVKQKRQLNLNIELKNCGLLNVGSTNYPSKSIHWTLRDEQNQVLKQQFSRKISHQFIASGVYYLESVLPAELGFCEAKKTDTILVGSLKTPILNMGPDYKVCKGSLLNLSPKSFETYDQFDLTVDGVLLNAFPYQIRIDGPNQIAFKVIQKNGCNYEDKISLNVFDDLKYKVYNDTFCSNSVFPTVLANIKADPLLISKIDYSFKSSASFLSQQNSKVWNFDVLNRSNPTAHVMKVYSVVSDLNFCEYKDSSLVHVLEPDAITVNAPESLCVNAPLFNLETKAKGGWTCLNYPSLIKNN